jgi:hypothetical protein
VAVITIDALYWPRARVTNQMQRKAREMRANGATFREIADAMGVEKCAPSRWFRLDGALADKQPNGDAT